MLRILGRPNSVNVQKVMWLVGELGLEHERLDVGGAFGGNDTPDYLRKNPNGRVPTLEDGDTIIWESNAIVRYLAEKFGHATDWYPADMADRGRANMWMDWYLTTLHPPMTTVFWTLIRTPEPERDMVALNAALKQAAEAWTILDDHLSRQDFVLGDTLTMGDIPVGCSAYRWHTMDIDRPDLPNLRAFYDRLNIRPAFQKHVMIPLT